MKLASLITFIVVTFHCFAQKSNSLSLVQDKSIYTWSGSINNKIPVFIWYIIRDSLVYGELTYTRVTNPSPLKLIGSLSNIYEYDKNGNATGIWQGLIKNTSFNGNWVSTKSSKKLPFKLNKVDTVLSVDTSTNAVNIDGVYRYDYPCGASGELNAKMIDRNHIAFNISCVTCAPYNVAQIDNDTIELHKNTAMYNKKNDWGVCAFSIDFYKSFATVGYPCDSCNQCGFGLNAEVGGTFVKISSKPNMK